jgi:Fuc2NAc and GlcNAc transferase
MYMGWLLNIFAVIYLVWLLNLYNFMDGIDGLAGAEAVSVCIGVVTLLAWRVPGTWDWCLPALLSLATLGFLVWNWPPAKIFMGDVGSCFLGLTLGGLSIQSATIDPALFWSWLILLGVFIVDSTSTLLHRILRGEKPYQPHRSHGYQNAALLFKSHLAVTAVVATINIVWLLPIAFFVALGSIQGITGLVLAYIPLIGLAIKLKAGAKRT